MNGSLVNSIFRRLATEVDLIGALVDLGASDPLGNRDRLEEGQFKCLR